METLQNIDCEQNQKKLLDEETTRFVAFLLELFMDKKISKEQLDKCAKSKWLDDLFTN